MTASLPPPIVRIIVCGNADRGDDGVALAAAATLLPTLPPELAAEARGPPLSGAAGRGPRRPARRRPRLIVDAVLGIEPGEVVRMPLDDLAERPAFTPRSSHELPIDLVVGLAGIIRERPVPGTFVGLGGHGFDYGTPCRGSFARPCRRSAEAIAPELERWSAWRREA